MRVLAFLHGTVLMHSAGVERTPRERVGQAASGREASVRDFAGYIPVDDAVATLRRWSDRGHEIDYVSSHRRRRDVSTDRAVLRKYGFPPGEVYSRRGLGGYGRVLDLAAPDIVVEDDCASIAMYLKRVCPFLPRRLARSIARREMISTLIRRRGCGSPRVIVVEEFSGIDHVELE